MWRYKSYRGEERRLFSKPVMDIKVLHKVLLYNSIRKGLINNFLVMNNIIANNYYNSIVFITLSPWETSKYI